METVTESLVEKFTAVVRRGDGNGLSSLFSEYPQLASIIDEPLFDFDSPAIVFTSNHCMFKMTETLLDLGANIDARSTWWAGGFGVLPTSSKVMEQHLISRGATIDIHAAAGMGMLERVDELLASRPDLINARGGDGQTPLHYASTVSVADRLLQLGADLEIRDIDHGSTPAQYAVLDRPDVCRFLINNGAKSDVFMLCALGELSGVQQAVSENAECLTWRTGDWLEAPAPGGHIYTYSIGGNLTPLQVSAKFKHFAITEWLCANGVELDIFTAWDLGRRETVAQMIGNDPELLNRPLEGSLGTLMHEAVHKGDAKLFEMLLSFDPDLNIKDSEYHSDVGGWASHFGNSEIVALIEKHRSRSQNPEIIS